MCVSITYGIIILLQLPIFIGYMPSIGDWKQSSSLQLKQHGELTVLVQGAGVDLGFCWGGGVAASCVGHTL